MHLSRLWLTDFRNYATAELAPAPFGLTVIQGANGEGKTNLLEAVAYLATLASFRNAPRDALVRDGCERAVVRAEAEREGRRLLLEAELSLSGRDRVQLNRQPLRRSRELLGALRVSVFSPDDLALVKAGPGGRRDYLDSVLVALHPRNDELQNDVERILRQRGALLKQSGGRLSSEIADSLDVWDAKLAAQGQALVDAREELLARLAPVLTDAYSRVARQPADVTTIYQRSWSGPIADALAASRPDDVRRGVTLVGPHRDEVVFSIGGLPARSHASQGEQRSLALALRLAGHQVVSAAVGDSPVLLLDDVFSELDPDRSDALLDTLPEGQAILTTAGPLPAGARPEVTVRVRAGTVVGVAA